MARETTVVGGTGADQAAPSRSLSFADLSALPANVRVTDPPLVQEMAALVDRWVREMAEQAAELHRGYWHVNEEHRRRRDVPSPRHALVFRATRHRFQIYWKLYVLRRGAPPRPVHVRRSAGTRYTRGDFPYAPPWELELIMEIEAVLGPMRDRLEVVDAQLKLLRRMTAAITGEPVRGPGAESLTYGEEEPDEDELGEVSAPARPPF